MAFARAIPSPNTDTTQAGTSVRTGRYAEQYVLPLTHKELYALDEGTYFTAITATPGTGVVGPVSTTFLETKAMLTLYNGGQNRIYPQYLQFHDTSVSVTDTRLQFTICLDTGNRYTSGGTALTIANCNMDSSNQSAGIATQGALVTTAATGSRRIIGHQTYRGTVDVVEDTIAFVFGGAGGTNSSNSRTATVQEMVRTLPPVCIGPGQTFLVHHWATAIGTGMTAEVIFGYIER